MAPDGAVDEIVPIAGTVIPLPAPARWLAVLGAVGQPRDRNPDACYALLDDNTNELTYVRVPYDVGCAAHKIVAAGLPQRLAVRLVQGW